jgi:membrane-bound serine protease (ClpP class)
MDPKILAIVMLFIGLALLIAEVFVPSGGMITILAVVCIAVSVWAAHQAWWETARGIWWLYLAALLLLAPGAIGGSLYMLQHTGLGRHILLDAPSLDEVTPYAEEEHRLKQLIGKRGITLALLNPGGMVTVDGERLHCESPGMLIERGEEVEVIGLKGNRLVVRLAQDADNEMSAENGAAQQPNDDFVSNDLPTDPNGSDDLPLDFEFPQS